MFKFRAEEKYIDSFVGWRGTKKDLEKELSEHYGTPIKLNDCTDKDCKEVDYLLTAEIVGDGDSKEWDRHNGYVDADFYFLRMRNKWIYITETALHFY